MSTELGKTVGQFKTFGIASMQRTMLGSMRQRDPATLNGIVLMMGLGATAYAMKQWIADRPLSDKPSVWAVEAFDKSGLSGWLMDFNGALEKGTRGEVGLSYFTKEPISRYASRNVTDAFLGPSVGAVQDIFQVSGSVFAGDTTKADLRKRRARCCLTRIFSTFARFSIRSRKRQVKPFRAHRKGLISWLPPRLLPFVF